MRAKCSNLLSKKFLLKLLMHHHQKLKLEKMAWEKLSQFLKAEKLSEVLDS